MYPLLLTTLIATAYPVWESKELQASWMSQGEGYEYILEVYTDKELTQLYLALPPITDTYTYFTVYDTHLYFHRVKYYHPDNPDDYGYIFLGQYYINLYYGFYTEDIPSPFPYPPVNEEPEPNPVAEPKPTPSKPTTVQPTEEEKSYSLPNSIDNREDIPNSDTSVLGIESSNQKDTCNVSIFKEKDNTSVSSSCDLDIRINKVKYINWGNYYTVETEGIYPHNIYVSIEVYECSKFDLLKPETWFGCKKELTDSYRGMTKGIYTGSLIVNGKYNNTTYFTFKDTSFYLNNLFTEDIYSKNVLLNLDLYLQVKSKEWIDVKHSIKERIVIPKAEKIKSNKPFSYPLKKLIGVTQWYGCTQYQCPHKGIDFGATKEKVVSIADGTVKSVGFDKYGGECNQGGNYVLIKHTNGMYSMYLHLDSYSVKAGQKVKKGEKIAVSGNTGKKNCQNFAYHLHFETRKQKDSSTHVNPVPYIDVDWNLIPTLGYKQNPGRLTGDNPHPNF